MKRFPIVLRTCSGEYWRTVLKVQNVTSIKVSENFHLFHGNFTTLLSLQVWMEDCNSCRCAGGRPICTMMACIGTSTTSSPIRPIPVGNECTPGATWKESCNDCRYALFCTRDLEERRKFTRMNWNRRFSLMFINFFV